MQVDRYIALVDMRGYTIYSTLAIHQAHGINTQNECNHGNRQHTCGRNEFNVGSTGETQLEKGGPHGRIGHW